MDSLSAALTDADDVKIDVQKSSGAKDTSETLSSANPPILVAATNPLSSIMDSRYGLTTKTLCFTQPNVYPPMILKSP